MTEEGQVVQEALQNAEKLIEKLGQVAGEVAKAGVNVVKNIMAVTLALIKSQQNVKGKIRLSEMVSQGKELVPF